MSIKELIHEGLDFFGERVNAALDAEVLLAHSLDVDREYLVRNFSDEVDEAVADLYRGYLRRVAEGEPIAYITGSKEFHGLDFYVDDRVLIPRPETEQIVDRVLDYVREHSDGVRRFKILDVGTGSGNIAVSLAKKIDDNSLEVVEAVDVSDKALEVARLNAEQHGVDHLVHFFESDLLEFVDEGERYDVVVANLPYIGEDTNRFVSAETEKYEPNVALFGGTDGLRLYDKLFQQIKDNDVSFDLMIGEFGFAQREGVASLLNRYFPQRWAIVQDLAGIDRIFVVTML